MQPSINVVIFLSTPNSLPGIFSICRSISWTVYQVQKAEYCRITGTHTVQDKA